MSPQNWLRPPVRGSAPSFDPVQESLRGPSERLRTASKNFDSSTQDFSGGHVRVSPQNWLRPPVRGSAKTRFQNRKPEELRLQSFQASNPYGFKQQEGSPPPLPTDRAGHPALRRAEETSKSAADCSEAKRDCGDGGEAVVSTTEIHS